MITVAAKKRDNDIIGFHIEGHAEYSKRRGTDIVCSAVSALAVNCINSIEELTGDSFSYGKDDDRGMLDFELTEEISEQSRLLLKSLFLGLGAISKSYGSQYVKII